MGAQWAPIDQTLRFVVFGPFSAFGRWAPVAPIDQTLFFRLWLWLDFGLDGPGPPSLLILIDDDKRNTATLEMLTMATDDGGARRQRR